MFVQKSPSLVSLLHHNAHNWNRTTGRPLHQWSRCSWARSLKCKCSSRLFRKGTCLQHSDRLRDELLQHHDRLALCLGISRRARALHYACDAETRNCSQRNMRECQTWHQEGLLSSFKRKVRIPSRNLANIASTIDPGVQARRIVSAIQARIALPLYW